MLSMSIDYNIIIGFFTFTTTYTCEKAFSHSSTPACLEVNIKFVESGHTNMECDSMHATIENGSKRAKICVPLG